MSSTLGLGGELSLSRSDAGEHRAARSNLRRWVLIWLGCAALSWMATVVIGYTVIRFGDTSGQLIEAKATDGEAITAEDLAAVKAIAPAAGTADTTEQSE